MGSGSAVAILTARLHKPADAVARSDGTHVAVTTLALHFHGAISCDCPTHCAAQALGGRSGVAAITCLPIARIIERGFEDRILNLRMQGMDRGGKLRDGTITGRAEGLGRMAGRTENRFAVGHHAAIQSLGIEAAGGESSCLLYTSPSPRD